MAENKGFFHRLREGLSKTRSAFTERVDELVETEKTVNDDRPEGSFKVIVLI